MLFGLMGEGMKYLAISLAAVSLFNAPAFADEKFEQDPSESAGVFTVQELPEGDLNWYRGYAYSASDSQDNFVLDAPVETDSFGLSWKGSGRWGLTLDVTRRSENLVLPQEEIGAGAYFQVTPRFRLGGGVRFRGDDVTDAKNWSEDEDRETDVRIESAFSF